MTWCDLAIYLFDRCDPSWWQWVITFILTFILAPLPIVFVVGISGQFLVLAWQIWSLIITVVLEPFSSLAKWWKTRRAKPSWRNP